MDNIEDRVKSLELDMIAMMEAVKKHSRILQGDNDLGVESLSNRMSQMQSSIDTLSDTVIRLTYFLAANACLLIVMGIVLVILLFSR